MLKFITKICWLYQF